MKLCHIIFVFLALCGVAASQSANAVQFNSALGGHYALKGLSYTVDSWIVRPDGVDHELYKGLTKSFDGTSGQLVFAIQRWGDPAVAKGIWERTDVSRTTADHEVTNANFAIFGTLKLTVIDFFGEYTHVLSGIMLAQYNSGTNNIWIFGGDHCVASPDSAKVTCMTDGEELVISFRKDGGSYTFSVIDYDLVEDNEEISAMLKKRNMHRHHRMHRRSKMQTDQLEHISRAYNWYGKMPFTSGMYDAAQGQAVVENKNYHPVDARRMQPIAYPGNYPAARNARV